MSKATPRPWRTEYHPGQKGTPATLIMQADAKMYEKWLAECPWGKDGDTDVADGDGTRDCTAAEAQANARLIVQAVNSFDELVATCKEMLEFLPKGEYPTAGAFSPAVLMRNRVRAVLEKAASYK